MKKTLVTSLLTILVSASLSLVLTSCENFLKGSSVKDDLEKKIYIANHDCPVATVEEPPFTDAGVPQNTSIVISFTMPMDPETFVKSFNIEDSEGNSLLEHFLTPVWSNNNMMVTIYANKSNIINVPTGQKMDIHFTLSKKCTTKDGLPIASVINYKYRVNDSKDSIPPTMINTSSITRPPVECQGIVISDSQELLEGSIDAQNEELICSTNHINSALDFYMEGKDLGGGKVRANINYGLVRTVAGKAAVSQKYILIKELTQTNEDGNKYANFSFDFNKEIEER